MGFICFIVDGLLGVKSTTSVSFIPAHIFVGRVVSSCLLRDQGSIQGLGGGRPLK